MSSMSTVSRSKDRSSAKSSEARIAEEQDMVDAVRNMTPSALDKSEEEAAASESLTAAEIHEHHYSAQTGDFLAVARGEVLNLIHEVRRLRTELKRSHMSWLTTEHIAAFIAGLPEIERRKLFHAILEQYSKEE